MASDEFQRALDEAAAALPGASKFLGRREIRELPGLLWEGELPERLIQGTYKNGNGLLVATNRRLLFLDKGMMSLKVEDFAYDRITSVQFSTGMLMGSVTIYASGNKAEIKNVNKDHARGFGEWLRNRIERSESVTSTATPGETATGPDPLAQLERLAKLREMGALTEDEFQSQKQQVLDRMR